MAEISAHDPATSASSAALTASIRRTAHHHDLDLIGLLAGIAGIVLAAILIFGATYPGG